MSVENVDGHLRLSTAKQIPTIEDKAAMRSYVWHDACDQTGMLKISSTETGTEFLLVLEGKLIVPWTDELKRACEGKGKRIDSNQSKLIIHVAGVTEISADGEEALLHCLSLGAKFRGGGVYMKQVLKQLARRIRRKEG